jgi:hypothetical protein
MVHSEIADSGGRILPKRIRRSGDHPLVIVIAPSTMAATPFPVLRVLLTGLLWMRCRNLMGSSCGQLFAARSQGGS